MSLGVGRRGGAGGGWEGLGVVPLLYSCLEFSKKKLFKDTRMKS